MVTAEAAVDVRQLVVVAAAVVAVVAVWARRAQPRPFDWKWHCAAAVLAVNSLYGFVRGRGTWVAYIGQPLVVTGIIAGLRPRSWPDRVAAALFAVGAIAGNVVEPLPDAVGAIYALYLAATESWSAVGATFCAAEAAAVAVLFATADTDEVTLRAEHYTWWSLTLFAVWDVLIFLDAYLHTRLANPFSGLVATVAVVVGVGVLYMSADGCALLQDALDEAGTEAYIVGNFLMHYYPIVRIFMYEPTITPAAVVRGVGLGVVYSLTYPATDVYGCSEPLPAYLPALMGGVGLAVGAGVMGVAYTASKLELGSR